MCEKGQDVTLVTCALQHKGVERTVGAPSLTHGRVVALHLVLTNASLQS
jgi:hypothetical protein